ncbi:MAG TPA: TonB-dependent receptor [Candidatus Avacidaminococcus intestinavium]|uniref:TonB-dependent receptor n=1 Tax=Candidatus Avacidaminococcus intestinavium TaxID=2840684 RepID=A0A9D1SKY4_9FIRM|nr:TonB-dependent receptor [Candidatus Avacidaminococcus intestinavium]
MKKSLKCTKLGLTLSVLLASGVMANSGFANSVERENEFSLDPMIITAQRLERKDLDTPAMTSIITAEDLKNTGASSVFAALEKVTGLSSTAYGAGGEDYGAMLSRANLRGLDKGTLVLINGNPVNLMNYNSMLNVIPVDAVEKIEVVKGSNTVLYGAEAMGGVINIITKKSPQNTGGSVGFQYGSYSKGFEIGAYGEGLNVFYKKENRAKLDPANKLFDPKKTYTIKDKSNNESLFFNYDINDKLSFNYAYNDAKNNYRTAKANGTTTKNNFYYRTLQNAGLTYHDQNNFKSSLTYNKYKIRASGDASTIVDASSIYFDNQKAWKLRNNKDVLVGGISLSRESYEKGDKPTFDRDSAALYTSYTYNISDKFSTVLGLRGHFVKSNSYDDAQNIFLPQIQTLYKINETSAWFTNIGKSFEMPSTTSPYMYGKVSTFIKLKPQEGWNYEMGWKRITDTESLKIAVFRMDIKNKFKWVTEDTLRPDGNSKTYVQINNDKFKNSGLEVEYTKKINDVWQANFGASISDPKSQEKNKAWIQDDARLQFTAGITYRKDKLTANLQVMFLGERQTATNSYYGKHRIPNKVDLNMTFGYELTPKDNVEFGVYNLLDRANPTNTGEYRSLPRNYILSYTRSF